jgi:hypothetical protein
MRGIDCDMTLSEFFRRLFRHITLAFAAWFVLALCIEILVPRSVTPFVDLADLGLLLLLMAIGNIWTNSVPLEESPSSDTMNVYD